MKLATDLSTPAVARYGPLDPLLGDGTGTAIMCNAYDDAWIERSGRLEPTALAFADDAQYRGVIDQIVAAVGRRVDERSPMVDARLPDGSRVNVIVPPLAVRGAVLTIRKFSVEPLSAKDLVAAGTYTADLVRVLEACVRCRLNVLVSGGTGTGKTTNLNVLSSFVPAGERIITIEDSAELQLQQPHVINLEGRPAGADGTGQVLVPDLVRNALRMRPDRIIVGECRAGETLDMLQAMNSGHEGSMSTVHANSPRDALARLEIMALMAGLDLPVRSMREQIASAMDVVVHLDRRSNGRRVATTVAEVQGMESDVILLQDIFTHRPGTGLVATGLRPKFADRLADERLGINANAFRQPPPALWGNSRSDQARRTERPSQ